MTFKLHFLLFLNQETQNITVNSWPNTNCDSTIEWFDQKLTDFKLTNKKPTLDIFYKFVTQVK